METFIIDNHHVEDNEIKGTLYISTGVVIEYTIPRPDDGASLEEHQDVYDKMTQGKISGILRPHQVSFLYDLIRKAIPLNSNHSCLDSPLPESSYQVYLFGQDKLHQVTLRLDQVSHANLISELEVLQYEVVDE